MAESDHVARQEKLANDALDLERRCNAGAAVIPVRGLHSVLDGAQQVTPLDGRVSLAVGKYHFREQVPVASRRIVSHCV